MFKSVKMLTFIKNTEKGEKNRRETDIYGIPLRSSFTMTNMKLLIGIVCMMQIYKGQCSSLLENAENTMEIGYYEYVVAVLKDPTSNSTPLEITFNLPEVRLEPPNQENQSVNGKEDKATRRPIKDCSSKTYPLCRETEDGIRLLVKEIDDYCQSFNYSSPAGALVAEINITGIHLYGGSVHEDLQWPADKQKKIRDPYIPSFRHLIIEPYWLTSNGYYIHVDEDVPLFISLDPQTRIFQLIAENTAPYVKPNHHTILSFTVCKFKNVKEAHEHAVEHVLGKPSERPPDINPVKLPTWTTWPQYGPNINEENVLKYAREIVQQGYEGRLVIDKGWERCYGSLEPDASKFPDLTRLVEQLKESQIVGVDIWVSPFVDEDCNLTDSTGIQQGYFVRNSTNMTLMIDSNGKKGSYVDFTNPEATKWYHERLMQLQWLYDINSFKFAVGEIAFLSQLPKFRKSDDQYSETIVKEYVISASHDIDIHTIVGRSSQRSPIFLTMNNRDEKGAVSWELSKVIPQLLQLNILGYSFLVSDVISSNNYDDLETRGEFYIRFLQACVFMPSIQFSSLPWTFGPMYNNLTKKFMDLRSQYIQKIIHLMHKTVVDGAPVNPPIWWIAPNDPEALVCDTEYLLGEDLLVAPVLELHKTSRDIYLPEGNWKDENNILNSTVIKGPTWLRNYSANLTVLPYFTRVR